MCGLVGFSGAQDQKFNSYKIKLLMLHNSITRGKDSTGFFSPKNGIIKSVLEASKALAKKLSVINEDSLCIGHVRQTTSASVQEAHTHPFAYGTIIGAHNGTLTNADDLLKTVNLDRITYPVDSMAIFVRLSLDNGPKVFNELLGSAAVIFHDTKNPEKLYTYRNEERPLFYGFTKEGMYISSLEEGLEIINCTDIKEFDKATLYEIVKGKIVKTYIIKEAKKVTTSTHYFNWPRANRLHGFNLLYDLSSNLDTKPKYNTFCKIIDSYCAPGKTSHMDTIVARVTHPDGTFTDYKDLHINNFSLSSYKQFFIKGSYLISVTDLESTKTDENGNVTKKQVAKAGDLCRILIPLESSDDKELRLLNVVNGERLFGHIRYFRAPLNDDEVYEFGKKLNVEIPRIVDGLLLTENEAKSATVDQLSESVASLFTKYKDNRLLTQSSISKLYALPLPEDPKLEEEDFETDDLYLMDMTQLQEIFAHTEDVKQFLDDLKHSLGDEAYTKLDGPLLEKRNSQVQKIVISLQEEFVFTRNEPESEILVS